MGDCGMGSCSERCTFYNAPGLCYNFLLRDGKLIPFREAPPISGLAGFFFAPFTRRSDRCYTFRRTPVGTRELSPP